MLPSRACRIAVLGLALGLSLACGKQTGVPGNDSLADKVSQGVPFDHASDPSESSSELPTAVTAKLHEGTPLAIRLLTPVSSASSATGDTFDGALDEPIVIDGETAVPRGAAVTGRVLAARSAGHLHDPGYLRIALVSLAVGGKRIAIETSSLFIKGGSRSPSGSVPGRNQAGFDPDRRLTFRLAQAVNLR